MIKILHKMQVTNMKIKIKVIFNCQNSLCSLRNVIITSFKTRFQETQGNIL